MTDNDIITESDIDLRPCDAWGSPYTEADLLTRDEWLLEFQANICCTGYTRDCPCGGYTDQLPSGASRLLDNDDEPDWESIAEARAEARGSREVELW